MSSLGIIYTSDSKLETELKPRLQQINDEMISASSLPELMERLQQSSPATVYLDLRSDELPSESDDCSSVLSYLREICDTPIKIVTILDQFLPVEHVETINFISGVSSCSRGT